jgi:predicted metalloprotease with PDZ domain
VQPTVAVPDGWTVFTALDGRKQTGNRVSWDVTDYETLVDLFDLRLPCPARFFLGNSVWLDAIADKPELLAIKLENLATHRALVDEGLALYGAKHFDHYDLLLALTDRMGGSGWSTTGRARTARAAHLDRLGRERLGPQRHPARILAQLGRQVPPPGQAVDARLSPADAGQPAVGL